MADIKVLGADYCPFCVRVKEYLETNQIYFQWVDTETSPGHLEREKLSKKNNYSTIPMVFVNGEFVGGCNEFLTKVKKGEIKL